MSTKTVLSLHQGKPTQDGAGVSLTRIIGQPSLPRLDPFLMLDFFGSDNPGEYIAGFPPHPHRGFQTVTYMLAGKMRHRDSVGNEGVIEAGGIQWMNAGRGLIHEEMPEQESGLLQGFQLWVNLPAKEKMSAPGYEDIHPDAVPDVAIGQQVRVKILAGEFNGVSGPVKSHSVDPLFIDVQSAAEEEVTLPLADEHNTFVYCYEGGLQIAEQPVSHGKLAVLSKGTALTMTMQAGTKCIIVSGAPIHEPVVQYGPFVMNTEAEIHQAIKDYQNGSFAG
ncbi:MAG: pirin family protein [Pseudomonadota bacterium]|nr:pirin family protein [Pseudomonadota bacterium]